MIGTTTPTPSSRDLYDVIGRRRDVRAEFSGEPLDDDVLMRVLGAAHQAPSVGLTQPWDFVVVRDPATRGVFADHVAQQRTAYADSLDADRAATFAPIKIEGVRESSAGVVVTYDPTRGGSSPLGRHTIADTGLYSTCLAIQNLWLAATAEGLGVGWVSFYREPFLSSLVGLPTHVRPVAWLCVGPVEQLQETPDLVRHGWRERRPLEHAVHAERWTRRPEATR